MPFRACGASRQGGEESRHPTRTKSLGDEGLVRLFVCPVSMRAPASRGTVPATRSTVERHPIQVHEFRGTSARPFFGDTFISFGLSRILVRVSSPQEIRGTRAENRSPFQD